MRTEPTDDLRDPTFQAFALLRTVFTIAPCSALSGAAGMLAGPTIAYQLTTRNPGRPCSATVGWWRRFF